MIAKQITLHATVAASPYDADYDMALVYCVDKASRYCFSLTRFHHEGEIEVMVLDQLNARVNDLEVTLQGRCLRARIPPELARRLDGHEQYIVHLDMPDEELPNLIVSLEKIFEGKIGLSISAA